MPTLQEAVRRVAPKANAAFVAALTVRADTVMDTYGMADAPVAARFLANCHHETMGFTRFRENLNYSAARIRQVWPSRPGAVKYANNPQGLANEVYANRMGNGPPSSGDGWRFAGGGGLHHTGKTEYLRVKKRTGHDPDTIREASNAVAIVEAAATYCVDRKVIEPWRRGDDRTGCIRVNGGLIGYEDRLVLTRRYVAVFNGQPIPKARTRSETADRQAKQAAAAAGGSGASATGAGTIAAPKPASPSPQAESGSGVGIMLALGFAAVALAGVGFFLWKRSRKTKIQLEIERDIALDMKAGA
jgi:putative chitinase